MDVKMMRKKDGVRLSDKRKITCHFKQNNHTLKIIKLIIINNTTNSQEFK